MKTKIAILTAHKFVLKANRWDTLKIMCKK